MSSLWCTVHGHRHPLIDAAVKAQLDRVAHSTMLGLSHPGAAELAARLAAIAPPGLERVFFSDNGSTAAEVAVKMAYQYWQLRGATQRTEFICLRDAYHGDTIGSVSVGGIDLFHATFRKLLFDTHQAEPGDAGDMRRLLEAHGERVAAVIVEPLVQGAAGMIVHPDGYLRAVRELCDEFGVLLVCDEVAVGFGRTGTMFACEQEGVAPDLMCVAKGTHRRLPAARRDAHHRGRLRGLPGRAPRAQDVLPRPHLHRQPACLRGRAGHARRVRVRADAGTAGAEDRAARQAVIGNCKLLFKYSAKY